MQHSINIGHKLGEQRRRIDRRSCKHIQYHIHASSTHQRTSRAEGRCRRRRPVEQAPPGHRFPRLSSNSSRNAVCACVTLASDASEHDVFEIQKCTGNAATRPVQ